MALLAAVAAAGCDRARERALVPATAGQADELERLREFSENILESLNDGLAVVDRDDVIVRWNRQLEEAVRRATWRDAVGHRADAVFDQGFFEVLRSARRDSSEGAAFYRVRWRHATRRCADFS